MNTLPVSKKVYSDITSRVSTALSHAPASALEALRLINDYLAGKPAETADTSAMIAFSMIKPELERAMTRSSRARERARLRKIERAASETADAEPAGQHGREQSEESSETPDESETPVMLSRRQRRAMQRARVRKTSGKWKRIA